MYSIWVVIFFSSIALILHTYLIYPVMMLSVFKRSRFKFAAYTETDNLPEVAVLIAAYNEEKVISEKIKSVFNSHYPSHKIHVFVGSDASSDNTEKIVEGLLATYPNLKLRRFHDRVGKINIINELQSQCDQQILIMTDANVMFSPDAIKYLVAQFKDERVGLVAANIIKLSDKNEGIAGQERAYLSIENQIKSAESRAFAYIMGAEGGCYAIRNSLFTKVPSKFIVDDFYITLQLILRGKKALFNESAICYEDVPGDSKGEYRRKVRISSGNFQNLFFFRHVLYRFWLPLGFMFWSHKVLRWMTPFFLAFALTTSAILGIENEWYRMLFFIQVLGLLSPLINHLSPFKNSSLRFVSHFYFMNFALLAGFFRFTSGIQSSVWQPVKRDV